MLDGGRCVGACRCEGCLVSGLCCVVRYTHFYHELVMCNSGGQHCNMYLKQLKRLVSISLKVGAGGNWSLSVACSESRGSAVQRRNIKSFKFFFCCYRLMLR